MRSTKGMWDWGIGEAFQAVWGNIVAFKKILCKSSQILVSIDSSPIKSFWILLINNLLVVYSDVILQNKLCNGWQIWEYNVTQVNITGYCSKIILHRDDKILLSLGQSLKMHEIILTIYVVSK